MKKIEIPEYSIGISSNCGYVRTSREDWDDLVKDIERVNAAIDKAVTVVNNGGLENNIWSVTAHRGSPYTHKALLINIEPIKKLTKEEKAIEFLEEFIIGFNTYADYEDPSHLQSYIIRAKEILGES